MNIYFGTVQCLCGKEIVTIENAVWREDATTIRDLKGKYKHPLIIRKVIEKKIVGKSIVKPS